MPLPARSGINQAHLGYIRAPDSGLRRFLQMNREPMPLTATSGDSDVRFGSIEATR